MEKMMTKRGLDEAPLEEEEEMEAPEKGKAPAKGEMDPTSIVTMMGMAMLDSGGLQEIQKALQGSQDPGQVTGAFLAQLMGRMAEMTSSEMGIDPKVYLKKNGFLDQILGYIERKLKLPQEFSDQVYAETLEAVKAAAMGGQGGQQQAGPPQAPAGPPAPAPAGPPGLDGGV